VSGGALIVGAAVGYFMAVPLRRIALLIMAFGSGVLISALAFELVKVAFEEVGMVAATTGFLLGAAIDALANKVLAATGTRHRKHASGLQPSADEHRAAAVLQSRWARCSTASWS
jgi:ZIP family zinc transporter